MGRDVQADTAEADVGGGEAFGLGIAVEVEVEAAF